MTTNELARLKRAASSKSLADERFREALSAAVDAHGPTLAGDVLGWTRQRVRQQLQRWKEQGR